MIAPKRRTYIIAVYQDGALRPNKKPKEHHTWRAAMYEAARLAKENPGLRFYILKTQAFAESKPPMLTML